MSVEEIQVYSNWIQDPDDPNNGWVPQVMIDYHPVIRCSNVATNPGNPPYEPDSTIHRVALESAQMDLLEADPRYANLPGTRQPYDSTTGAS